MTLIAPHDRFVGIDVAKAHLDVHVLPEGRHWRTACTPDALAGLLSDLHALAPALIVMEASGGYERASADLLAGGGLPVAIVNPRNARRFAGSLGRLAKTDRIDAELLACFAQRIQPTMRHKPDPERTRLAALVARRRQLVAMAIMEKQRCDPALADPEIAPDIEQHLRFLEQQVAAIDQRIAAIIAGHPIWAQLATALQQVKGVGPATATALVTHMPELGTLNRRQAAALAGLAPINRDSGTARGRRFTQGGRTALKTALYLAALSAARHHETLSAFYQTLRNAGKAPKAALIAVARKLLILLNAIARKTLKPA